VEAEGFLTLTISTDVRARLRGEILGGGIPPGGKINVDRVKSLYGVSLSPLREALSQLVAEGLVEADENRGFRAAPVSKENLREIFWLRGMLETTALRRAIEFGDDAWEAEIVSSLHRLEKLSYRRAPNRPNQEWEHWHRQFHLAVIAACRAPLLVQFCGSLHDQADRYRRTFLKENKQSRDSHQEHRDIAAAALKHDADKACRLMAKHIERTGADILAAMPDT